MRGRTAWAPAAAAAAAVLVWSEWLNRRWSRTLVGEHGAEGHAGHGGHEGVVAVVVLGFRNPRATVNAVNRWRVRAGLRSAGTGGSPRTRLVFSGGAPGGGVPEARLMAGYARSVAGFRGTVLVEDRSRTTWENVTNVIPFLEDADHIQIVSQPAHALKARVYLRRLRPDLAQRLVAADDWRPGEQLLLKPLLALYGLWTLRALTPGERSLRSRSGSRTRARFRTVVTARAAVRQQEHRHQRHQRRPEHDQHGDEDGRR